MSKSIFRNTIFKTMLNMCNIIIPILVGPYLTRVLDKDVYGLYNATNATFTVLLTIAAFGIYNYGLREVSKIRDNKAATEKLFSELLMISLISNFIISVLYIGYALFFTSSTTTVLYMLFAIQFIGNSVYIEWVNEAVENYSFITIKTVLIRSLYVVAIFLFVRKGTDLIPYTLIMSLTYTFNCLASFYYVSRRIKVSFKNLELRKHIKPLIVVFIIMNVNILYTQTDKIMLSAFVNDPAVSVYQIPHYIMSMINSLAIAIATVSVPRLSHVLHTQGKEEFIGLHRSVSRSFLFLLFPACIGVFVLSKEIILLYGSVKYIECVIPMAIFSLVYIPTGYTYLFGDIFLYLNGHERILAAFHFCGGMTNITLNFILVLIGKFNVISSIITLFIAYLLVAVICYVYIRKKLHVKCCVMDRYILRYLLLSLLFIPIAWIIRKLGFGLIISTGLTICACGIVYLGGLALMKDVNIQLLTQRFLGPIKRHLHKS